MSRLSDHIEKLRGATDELRRKFGVESLAIFGSAARREDDPDSDVDILVRFHGPAQFDVFMELKYYLESLLECRIDLVTEGAVRPSVRSRIERDLIRVA